MFASRLFAVWAVLMPDLVIKQHYVVVEGCRNSLLHVVYYILVFFSCCDFWNNIGSDSFVVVPLQLLYIVVCEAMFLSPKGFPPLNFFPFKESLRSLSAVPPLLSTLLMHTILFTRRQSTFFSQCFARI